MSKENIEIFTFFTIDTIDKNNKLCHYIVKGEDILDVINYTQKKIKSPVIAVYPTNYIDFLDTSEKLEANNGN